MLSPTNEVSPPPVRLQLQATAVGEVVIKGLAANRYLAMNRDGRLFGAVSYSLLLFLLLFLLAHLTGRADGSLSLQIFSLPKHNLLVEL